MKYKILNNEKEIMEKVNAIDLDALIEKMGAVKIDAKSRCASLVYLSMDPAGDTIYQLDVKPKEDGVDIFAKETHFEEYGYNDEDEEAEFEECEGEFVTDQIHKYLGGEKWSNLYKLLIKEINTLKEDEDEFYDEYYDEHFLMLNSNEDDKIIPSTTALAIFKAFVEGISEKESDTVFFELGFRSTYEMITSVIHPVVEVTEE